MTRLDTFYADPPLGQWPVGAEGSLDSTDRVALTQIVNRHAARFGTAPLAEALPWLATGHQAWFWHPGILAKDMAMSLYTRHGSGLRGAGIHLVVDHDVHPMTSVTVPVVEGETLGVQTVSLASPQPGVLGGAGVSGVPGAGLDPVRDWHLPQGACFRPLKKALVDLPVCDNLAQQMGVLLCRLMEPWTGPLSLLFATDLMRLPVAARFFECVLSDPWQCVRAYNAAVAQDVGAGILPLSIEPDRIELPVWLVRWQKPRLRVYVDIADSRPLLVDETGEVVDRLAMALAPRALLLTALMRGGLCDLFIHGKGGQRYDKITEHWWSSWMGESLCPMVTVSADLYLDFDVPMGMGMFGGNSGGGGVEHAVWYAHHLPHNLDRYIPFAAAPKLVGRKRMVLEQMAQAQEASHKAKLFKELHAINKQLAEQHADLIEQAQQKVHEAYRDQANSQIAQKRDWPFWIYPAEQLTQLADQMRQAF